MNSNIIEIFKNFNKVVFYEDTHSYYVDGKKFISVTTLLGKFKEVFDEDYWSKKKAEEYGVTQEDVLYDWKMNNLKATTKGSIFHNYAENYLNNKVFPYPKELVLERLGKDEISNDIEILKDQFHSFYTDCFGKLIPIKSELIVYDEELEISGMVDQLFWNMKFLSLDIYDWKTNKEFNRNSKFNNKLKFPLQNYDECEYIDYSIQLNLYKYIIEKNTSLKINNLYIVWFNINNDNYKLIRCLDMQKEIELVIQFYSKNKKLFKK